MARPATLLWFRLDLRLADNPALSAALARGGPVVPVYVHAPKEEGEAAPGAASRVWLHQSLAALDASLRARGSRLVVRRGPAAATLAALAEEVSADAVVFARRYEPAVRTRDERTCRELRARGLAVEEVGGGVLFPPELIRTRSGGPFQMFTPFWQACLAAAPPAAPRPAPSRVPGPRRWPAALPIAELGLLPTVDWASGIRAAWTPGEVGARARLRRFVAGGLGDYQAGRDRVGDGETSRLSPHLHHGEVSPRQVWHAVLARAGRTGGNAEAYLRELGWREFAHHLLFHFPATVSQPLRPAYAAFPWANAPDHLRAWQRGRTGYPLVDAGMRELWTTGFMHNRVRMVVASFLTKDLLLPWQEGARWFWDTLVDADLANNTLGWQWVAGSGADAAPYFRVFNPVTQARRHDATGAYVRRWVPELARLPDRYLHAPASAPPAVLREAGVVLGRHYPGPIIDHGWARQRALAAHASLSAR